VATTLIQEVQLPRRTAVRGGCVDQLCAAGGGRPGRAVSVGWPRCRGNLHGCLGATL